MPGIGIGITPVMTRGVGTVLADWHYDPDIASSGDGKTLEGAFKTWAEVAAVWSAGESVWVEPKDDGTKFREAWIFPGAGCSILGAGLYNNTTKTWSGGPQVSGADIYANASFVQADAPNTNVYTFSITVEASGTFINITEDGVLLTRVADIATCQSTAGSYYVSGEAGAVTGGLHPPASDDPTGNGKVYEYTARNRVVYGNTTCNACTVSGIHAEMALYESGPMALQGASCTMTHISAKFGNKHTLQIMKGGSVTNFKVLGGYFGTTPGTLVNYNADVFDGETMTFTTGWIGHSSLTVAGWTIMYGENGHNNISGALAAVTFSGVTFENLNLAVQGNNHTSAINVTNCTFTNVKQCVTVTATADVPVGGCTLTFSESSVTTNITDNEVCKINSTGTTVIIDGLTVTQDASCKSTGWIPITSANTVTVRNCNFIQNLTSGTRLPIYCSSNGANVTITGNVYNSTGKGWSYHHYWHASASGMTWTADNNKYEATNDAWYTFGTNYTDFATYQAAVAPVDANSTSN